MLKHNQHEKDCTCSIYAHILIFKLLLAQTRPIQDVRRVTVTSKCEIVDGNKTNKYAVFKQNIYDSLGQLHTIVQFSLSTGKVESYIWNTFQNGLLIRTEEYNDDKLIQRTDYSYTTKSLINNETVYRVVGNDTVLHLNLKYTYSSQGKPTKINAKTAQGKKAYILLSAYDNNGHEIKRKVNAKKGFMPKDSILEIKNQPKFNTQGRIESEQIFVKYYNGSTINSIYKYLYDDKGNMVQKTGFDANGNLLFTYNYKYNSKGKVIVVDKLDSTNKIVESFAMRYEAYPKSDITRREVEY